jgi:HSP20 family molecular chaperone IbpA
MSNQISQQDKIKNFSNDMPQRPIRPSVDIYEDKTGITLTVDLPGVSKESLDIQIDHETLSIDAYVGSNQPEDVAENTINASPIRYQRKFSIRPDLDLEKIEAVIKDGVLSVHIQKQGPDKPRSITVKAA